MSRDLTPAVVAQAQAAACEVVHLVELKLDEPTGTIRLTDAYRSIEWNGDTFLATGHLLGIGEIEESSDAIVRRVAIQLSGVDLTYVALLLAQDYLDRQITIYKAFLDGAAGVVTSPVLMFYGLIDCPTIEEDGQTCRITVEASNKWIGSGRRPGRHTNHEDQKVEFPDDTGFQYVAGLMNTPVIWGTRRNTGWDVGSTSGPRGWGR